MGFRDRLVSRLGYELTPAFVPDTENRGIANTAPAREAIGVTPTTALSLVAVSRATSVLETAVMQIPVNVYRGNTQLPTPLWLETPDIENQISQAEWLGTTLIHMAIFGNDAPKKARVEGIEVCPSGSKYGDQVEEVEWSKCGRNVVVDLDNGTWAYGTQIKPI